MASRRFSRSIYLLYGELRPRSEDVDLETSNQLPFRMAPLADSSHVSFPIDLCCLPAMPGS